MLHDLINVSPFLLNIILRLIHDTLILASSNIKHDVKCLAPQLLARLLAFGQQSQKIDSLIKQCYGWCYEQTSALFIPQSACLISAGGPLRTNLRGHEQRVKEIVVTSDDKFIATSAEDSLINIWNSSNFDCLHTLRIADKGPSCLVLTPDEKRVIGSSNCAVGMWDIDTGEALWHFHNESAVTCLAVSPDGIFIITGGVDGVVRVWHTGNGKKRKTLNGHEGENRFLTCLYLVLFLSLIMTMIFVAPCPWITSEFEANMLPVKPFSS